MGTRASQVIAHIDEASSFGIKKVGGNRKGATDRSLRLLCFNEKKMIFSEEVVFFRLKYRSKVTNVVDINEKSLRGMYQDPYGRYRKNSPTFGIVSSLQVDSESGVGLTIRMCVGV